MIVGLESNAGILDNPNESESPEHDAVDTQIVSFCGRLEMH